MGWPSERFLKEVRVHSFVLPVSFTITHTDGSDLTGDYGPVQKAKVRICLPVFVTIIYTEIRS
jgi:hypothetical protein